MIAWAALGNLSEFCFDSIVLILKLLSISESKSNQVLF